MEIFSQSIFQHSHSHGNHSHSHSHGNSWDSHSHGESHSRAHLLYAKAYVDLRYMQRHHGVDGISAEAICCTAVRIHPRSSKVVDFSTNLKPDVISCSNSDVGPVSRRLSSLILDAMRLLQTPALQASVCTFSYVVTTISQFVKSLCIAKLKL